jgi:hypothetical protein
MLTSLFQYHIYIYIEVAQNYSQAIRIALEKDTKSTAKSHVIRQLAISFLYQR